jgi:hypothetical protein
MATKAMHFENEHAIRNAEQFSVVLNCLRCNSNHLRRCAMRPAAEKQSKQCAQAAVVDAPAAQAEQWETRMVSNTVNTSFTLVRLLAPSAPERVSAGVLVSLASCHSVQGLDKR